MDLREIYQTIIGRMFQLENKKDEDDLRMELFVPRVLVDNGQPLDLRVRYEFNDSQVS
ncbi:MAG: hypothetical protein AABX11_00405 [Nanoarchaeota archaeon]